jgi:hypothetical protein
MGRRFWLLSGLMLIGVFFIMAKQVRAVDYFVATTGNDSNNGSQQSPWKTIKKGIESLRAGDNLYITAGIYHLAANVSPIYNYSEAQASGTSQNPIKVTTYGGKVIIDGDENTGRFIYIDRDYWVVENLELRNFRTTILMIPGSYNVIRNNVLHDMKLDTGLFSADSGTDIGIKLGHHLNNAYTCGGNVVENNRIYKIPLGEGIYIGHAGENYVHTCENNLISDNIIYEVWEGIDSKINAQNNIYRGNEIYNFHHFGNLLTAIYVRKYSRVVNNLIYNNPVYAIWIDGGTNSNLNNEPMGMGNEFYHNTIVGNKVGIAFFTVQNLKNNLIMNNISAFNSQAQIDNRTIPKENQNQIDFNDWFGVGDDQGLDGDNTLKIDPGFMDWTGNDFRLLPDSLVINMGTAVGVSDDFAGNLRVDGKPDMGAYEYVGSSPSPTPPIVSGTLEFEAEDMSLTSPMVTVDDPTASGGKFIQSGTTAAGVASYVFQVPDGGEGDYRIEGRVIAANGGDDSFYVSMDQPSTAGIDAWDIYYEIPETERSTSWGWDEVTYRGSGVYNCPQSDPKIFDLSKRVYTLYIHGKETNTKLDVVRIVKGGVDWKKGLVNWLTGLSNWDRNCDGKVNSWDWTTLLAI